MIVYNFYDTLLHLLAIILSGNSQHRKLTQDSVFKRFLKEYVPDWNHAVYSEWFQRWLVEYSTAGDLKKISSNSVKIIRFCSELNSALYSEKKHFLLLHVLQLTQSEYKSDVELQEYVKLASDSLNIAELDFLNLQHFVDDDFSLIDEKACRQIMPGLYCLYLPKVQVMILKSIGNEYAINHRPIITGRIYKFPTGARINDAQGNVMHKKDVKSLFGLKQSGLFQLYARNISHSYSGKKVLHPISFSVSKCEFVGIIGQSGSGKSTLLRILAGNLKPETGNVNLAGYFDSGIKTIGLVPQHEAFIPEFTVQQILEDRFKLLRLSGSIGSELSISIIGETLNKLGLADHANQKAGDLLHSELSGGQLKRLSIALEMLRNPDVLLVDEPTSGLSSADAREILQLLRDIANQGRIVICPMHQPSYEYLHFTDNILILDKGGYPVYFGNTADASDYLREKAHVADSRAVTCASCNHYDPDDLFSIITEHKLDESGNYLNERKISPESWYKLYTENIDEPVYQKFKTSNSRFVKQKVKKLSLAWFFVVRDVKRRVKKPKPLMFLLGITVLLSLLIGFLSRGDSSILCYGGNPNVPAAFLMMCISSLFIGMIASANEIKADIPFRKSENRISKNSFLWISSKLLRMFCLSFLLSVLTVLPVFLCIQAPLNNLQHILLFWLVYFDATVMGLLLSLLLRRTSVVYLFIPVLIVPQLLMSGLIIDFKRFPDLLQNPKYTPIAADFCVSRWAFEAMAVDAFVNNCYEQQFYKTHYQKHHASYNLNCFIPEIELEMKNNLDNAIKHFTVEQFKNPNLPKMKASLPIQLNFTMQFLKQKYENSLTEEQSIYEQLSKVYDLKNMREQNHNIYVERLVSEDYQIRKFFVLQDEIVRWYKPVFTLPDNRFGRAHYFAPAKRIGNQYMDTFWFNTLVIACMNALLSAILFVLIKVLGNRKLYL